MKKKSEVLDLDYEIDEENIFFSVGGERRLKMKMGKFLCLINRDNIRYEVAQSKNPGKEFEDLGPKEYVTVHRLIKKGMSLSQAASVMGIEEPRLRRFFNYAREKYSFESSQIVEELRRQAEAGRDYAKAKKQPSRRGLPEAPDSFSLVDLGKVKCLVNQGMEPPAIAEKLNLDREDFAEWFTVNAPLLDVYR
jgi:hypothetical protein